MKAVILEGVAVNPGDIDWSPFTDLVETKIYENTTEENKWDHIGDAEIVITNKVIMDEEVFSRFPQIKYVGVNATGYNVVDTKAAKEHGIIVTNIPAYSTDSVVQHTWALILELASKVSMHNESVQKGDWIRSETFCYWLSPLMELAGKTLGIVGFGNIGRGVAKIGQDFGMKVLVYTANPSKYKEYEADNLQFTDLNTVFEESDVLSLHCPQTAETTGLVNREMLSKMKKNALLINVARGGVVVDQDLADALKEGKIAGAGLDVVSKEPMAKDSVLLGVPNLIITPHIAWASCEARTRLVGIAAENLKGFLAGKPINTVG